MSLGLAGAMSLASDVYQAGNIVGIDDQEMRSGLQTIAARYPADYATYRDIALYGGDGVETPFSIKKDDGTLTEAVMDSTAQFGDATSKSPFKKRYKVTKSLRSEVDEALAVAVWHLQNTKDSTDPIFKTALSPFLGSKGTFKMLPRGVKHNKLMIAYSRLWNTKYDEFNKQFPQTFGVKEYDDEGMSLSGVNRQLFGPGQQRGSSSGPVAEPTRPRMR